MTYLDSGFDQFLNRDYSVAQGDNSQELDPAEVENYLPLISGSKVQGGVVSSPDGKVQVNLEEGFFKVSNGVEDLVRLGLLPDGSVGLLLKDNNGNILMQISGNTNIVQSFNKHMVLNFNDENLTISDDNLVPIAILGKISG